MTLVCKSISDLPAPDERPIWMLLACRFYPTHHIDALYKGLVPPDEK